MTNVFTVVAAFGLGAAVRIAIAEANSSAEPSSSILNSVNVSALHRPVGKADPVLPKEIFSLPIAEYLATDAASTGRLLQMVDGRSYWVVPGQSSTLCLLATSGTGTTFESAGTCGPATQLKSGSIWFSEDRSDTTTAIAMLLPDSMNKVVADGQERVVGNNFSRILITRDKKTDLKLIGEGSKEFPVDLGDFRADN